MLRRFVEAMGGELEIVALFADHLGQDQEFCRFQRQGARLKIAGHEAGSEDAPAEYRRKTETG
jgi:hypothetical protein